MKNFFSTLLYNIALAIGLASSHICLSSVNVLFTPDRIATISTTQDQNDNSILLASVGNIINGVISDPTTWTTTNLSLTTGFSVISNPSVSVSPTGDIIVAWTYLNTNYTGNIAAAILLNGSSTWSITNITNYIDTSSNSDSSLACDSNGNVYLAWNTYNSITGERFLFGTTTTLNVNSSWDQPRVIVP